MNWSKYKRYVFWLLSLIGWVLGVFLYRSVNNPDHFVSNSPVVKATVQTPSTSNTDPKCEIKSILDTSQTSLSTSSPTVSVRGNNSIAQNKFCAIQKLDLTLSTTNLNLEKKEFTDCKEINNDTSVKTIKLTSTTTQNNPVQSSTVKYCTTSQNKP